MNNSFRIVIKEQTIPLLLILIYLNISLFKSPIHEHLQNSMYLYWLSNELIQESPSVVGGGQGRNKNPKTFPSKCKHEALANLRSTVVTGFSFPQSSFLEILDGAE